jgi:polyhydroxyalkanoate synthesis regulator phasin
MITTNPLFQRMIATGEEQFAKVAGQLISNEAFLANIQAAVTRAIEAKGIVDRQITAAMQSTNVPTQQDLQKLNDRLDELERIFEGLVQKVDTIATKLDERR